jgi:hypothetical protein
VCGIVLKLRVDELARGFCWVIVPDLFVHTVLARYVYAFSGSGFGGHRPQERSSKQTLALKM